MQPRTQTVLLVGPDAEAWALDDVEGIDLTTTPSATAARAYLTGTAFDVVFLQEGVGGESGLRALRDVLGLATPVEVVASRADVEQWLASRGETAPSAPGHSRALLEELKLELGRVAHALNNPLSVIMGNAQLGIELAAAMDTDESIVEALKSIHEAGGELGELFSEVADLRDRVDRLLGT
ncbi:MAG: histidine kinase dimerization/phospho-acceptor domain-containing protein [Bacteroidota bacterium]